MSTFSVEYRGRMIYADTIKDLIDKAVAQAIDDAAGIADNHPHQPDADPGCVHAQGCCEVIAQQIRELTRRK
jgi:hypothetical protein